MSHTSSKPALLLSAVGLVLALVVGLIGTSGRGPALPRALPNIEPAGPYAPAQSALLAPRALPPLTDAAPRADAEAPPVAAPPAPATAQASASPTRLAGFVLRADGEPASDARVVLGKQHVRCDAQGQFELAIEGDPSDADLLAFEPGSEPALRPAFGAGLARGGEFQVRLLLGPETLTLAGNVVDAEGHGLKGWTVELDGLDVLRTFNLRERVRTDGDGRFELADVPAGSHVVRAWKESAANALRSGPAAAGETGITIVVR